jgi:hypothetical protein
MRAGDPTGIAGYHLEGVLGAGGMGTVYLARDSEGRHVALKVIRREFADNGDFRARFAREAAHARRVARFSTAPVLDHDAEADEPYIVTEFVEGLTLAQRIATAGPMRGATLDQLAVVVAGALQAIHAAGLVHRDLKPSNVMLSPSGPRVIDFGVAHAVDGGLSRGTSMVGTLGYMAPEQIRGEPVAAQADVFTWGAVVAFAGTGRHPFGGGDQVALMYRSLNEDPDLAGLEPPLVEVVRAALAKDPATRPDLASIIRQLSVHHVDHPGPGESTESAALVNRADQNPEVSATPLPVPAELGTLTQVTVARWPSIRPVPGTPAAEETASTPPITSPAPNARAGRRWRLLPLGAFALVALVALVGLGLWAPGGRGLLRGPTAGLSPGASMLGVASARHVPTSPTPAPSADLPSSAAASVTSAPITTLTTLTRVVVPSTPARRSSSPSPAPPQLAITDVSQNDRYIYQSDCLNQQTGYHGPPQTEIWFRVPHTAPLASVVATYTPNGGAPHPGGSLENYTGSDLWDFWIQLVHEVGPAAWTITATDTYGDTARASGSVTVVSCDQPPPAS